MTTFEATLSTTGRTAVITLTGTLDADGDLAFRRQVEAAAALHPTELVLELGGLQRLSTAGVRALAYARQQIPDDVQVVVSSPGEQVRDALIAAELYDSVTVRG